MKEQPPVFVYESSGGPVYNAGNGFWFCCHKKCAHVVKYAGGWNSVEIPEKFKNLPVTHIDEYSMSDDTSLVEVVIPETVTDIEYHAFKNCNNLQKVIGLGNVRNVNSKAFAGCGSIDCKCLLEACGLPSDFLEKE